MAIADGPFRHLSLSCHCSFFRASRADTLVLNTRRGDKYRKMTWDLHPFFLHCDILLHQIVAHSLDEARGHLAFLQWCLPTF